MKKVLIISTETEPGTDLILAWLNHLGVPWYRLNMDAVSDVLKCGYEIGTTRNIRHFVHTGDGATSVEETFDLDDVGVVLFRRHTNLPKALNYLPYAEEKYVRNEMNAFWDGFFLTLDDKMWVNDWRRTLVTKPEQLIIASTSGLMIPRTLLTNDPAEIRQFYTSNQNKMIVKPASDSSLDRSKEYQDAKSRGTLGAGDSEQTHILLTEIESHHIDVDKSASLSMLPSLYQEKVVKAFELRVVVIGTDIFAVAMYTQENPVAEADWKRLSREDLFAIRHEPYELPLSLQNHVLDYMRRAGLVIGVMDFAVTPAGDYVFFEVNTSGQWGWIEHLTKAPITPTLVKYLASYL